MKYSRVARRAHEKVMRALDIKLIGFIALISVIIIVGLIFEI